MTAAPIVAGLELAETYRLIRQLGKGGMGEVWEAEHLRLPRKVAIKFLLMGGQGNSELESRFQREAEIASSLKHPHIIDVHDFNVLADGTPYIVMEHLEGQDLRARLEAGPLQLEETLAITRQVASALSVAHGSNVVHRDLKPENIFLCESHDGRLHAKVLDFGISKLRNSVNSFATQEHTLLGTPGYMSPEQAMGKHASLDGRADLFSLATIVYEMLTGHSLFAGDSLAEIVYKVVHHSPPPLAQLNASVPRGLSAAVAQALEKDPDSRQASVQGFVSALDLNQGLASTAAAFNSTVQAATQHSSQDPQEAPTVPPREVDSAIKAGAARKSRWPIATALLAATIGAYALIYQRTGSPPVPDQRRATPDHNLGETKKATKATKATKAAKQAPLPTEPLPAALAPAEHRSNTRPAITTGAAGPASEPSKSPHPAVAPDRAHQSKRKMPAEQTALLRDARHALAKGNLTHALQRARSSLRLGKSPEAFETMLAVYCQQHDIGMAQAMLRNLRGSRKRRAIRACRKAGLTL